MQSALSSLAPLWKVNVFTASLLTRQSTPSRERRCHPYRGGHLGGKIECHDILKRRLQYALFLTCRNFATFWNCHEHSNGRCPRDVFIRIPFISMMLYFINKVLLYLIEGRLYSISAWAIGVARSTIPGNAKASTRGTGNRQSSHAFFFMP